MNDSIKYGTILSVVLFSIKWLANSFQISELETPLIALAIFIYLIFVILRIKSRNKIYFPFKIAWLSAFNILNVSCFAYSFLLIVFKDLVFKNPTPIEIAIQYIFIDFITIQFMGSMISLAIAFISMKRQKL